MALMECLRQSEIILLIFIEFLYTLLLLLYAILGGGAYTENILFFSFTTILT